MRVHRKALERLRKHKNGADATSLYTTLVDCHAHRPGYRFAVVPDAMRRNGLLPFGRNRGYKAIDTLLELQLLTRVQQGKSKRPSLYQLLSPALENVPYKGGEGFSITLMSKTGHEA